MRKAGERRYEPKDSLDFFPTPPWASRALFKHVLHRGYGDRLLSEMSVLEPACGNGKMAEVLKDNFATVSAADIEDYGYPSQRGDYLQSDFGEHDWMITNPPFNRAEEFIHKAIATSRVGVAVLVRLAFLETIGRYNNLFRHNPPTKAAVFVERVPFAKGRLDAKMSSSVATSWLIWEHEHQSNQTELIWIPPCRSELECEGDYD